MPSTTHRHSPCIAALLLLAFCCASANALQCYVCGPLQKGFQKTCDEFALNSTQFIATCPEKYFGCSTHFEGTIQRKQCERGRFNDCKKANGIEYCFCSMNLCNGLEGINPKVADTDDEDILNEEEGSGDHSNPPTKEQPPFKDDIDVVIADVGNSINTIETKTNGCGKTTSFTAELSLILIFTFSLY